MSTRYRKQSIVARLFLPIITLIVLAYFSYHAVSGRYGYRALERDQAEIIALLERRDALRVQRKTIQDRIALLDLAAIDPDLLDERARELLGYVRSDEFVIYLD